MTNQNCFERKIIAPEKIALKLENYRKNKQLVFSNGCFDLFHYGHLIYLQQAKQLGDSLIVALNSDESIKKLKGSTRPWMPLKHRLAIIAALEFVDWVTWFETDTPITLLKNLKPDILVKGGDYKLTEVVGKAEVENYGGKVAVVDLQKNLSSQLLFKKINPN